LFTTNYFEIARVSDNTIAKNRNGIDLHSAVSIIAVVSYTRDI